MREPVPNQLSTPATPNAVAGTPVPADPASPPPAPSQGGGLLGRFGKPLVIRLGLVAAIAVGGILVRDFVSGSPNALKVGDCIDEPTTESIEDVQHHPCDQAHTGEVFSVFEYAAERGAAYPDDATLDTVVGSRCYSEFATYTGTSYDDREDLDFTYLFPAEESWTDGERTIICYLVRVDGTAMTSSMRGAAR